MLKLIRSKGVIQGWKDTKNCHCNGDIRRCNMFEWNGSIIGGQSKGTRGGTIDKYVLGKHKYCVERIKFIREIFENNFGSCKL